MQNINKNLKKVQSVQLEILKEFVRICNKYNLKYQLFAGTLLGCVRHKKFIPWDDDIDVAMLRKDYNKFINICEKELDKNYFLQTTETDRNYNNMYAKIRKNNTLFIEENTSECDIHHGIYIDVFPLDNVLPNSILGFFQQKSLYILGRINLCRIKKNCHNIKKPIIKRLSLVCHYILKIFPKNKTDRLLTKIAEKFMYKNTKYITHLTNGASKKRYNKYMTKRKDFSKMIDAEFENEIFKIPKNYDYILTNIYGNYMKLPPINEIKPHHGVIKIIFDTQKKEKHEKI